MDNQTNPAEGQPQAIAATGPVIKGPLTNENTLRTYLGEIDRTISSFQEDHKRFLERAIEELILRQTRAFEVGFCEMEKQISEWIDQARYEINHITAMASAPSDPASACRDNQTPQQSPNEAIAHSIKDTQLPEETGLGNQAAPAQTQKGEEINRMLQLMATAPSIDPHAQAVQPAIRVRSAEDITAALASIQEQMSGGEWNSKSDLLRLKAILCQDRRIYQELELSGADVQPARGVYDKLRATARQYHSEEYLIPLDTAITPRDPETWERLSRAYKSLAVACQAWDWFLENNAELRTAQVTDLLNGIVAAQQCVRMVTEEMGPGSDPQQEAIFYAVRDYARAASIYLLVLDGNGSITDTIIREQANGLCSLLESLRKQAERKQAQNQTLSDLFDLLKPDGFGRDPDDDERLVNATLKCLDAGVPTSNKAMRDALLPWAAFLTDPRLKDVFNAVHTELDRRHAKNKPISNESDTDEVLGPDIQQKVEEVLPYTRGKTMVFMGGHPQPEKKQKIQDMLQLNDLIWEDSSKSAGNPYVFESEIKRADIVVLLIRFMRTGFKQSRDICNQHAKLLVRFPRGLGLSRIITDLYAQLPLQ